MAEYSKLASGQVVSGGSAIPVMLPFQPTRIEIYNTTAAGAGAGVSKALWTQDMGQAAAFLTTLTAFSFATTPAVSLTANVDSYITSDGFSTMEAAYALQYGSVIDIASVSAANPAVVTTSVDHGLASGSVVIMQNLYQTASTGMAQLCGVPFVVTVLSSTTFSIEFDTTQSAYTAYDSGTASVQATVKEVLYPALYFPGVSYITSINRGNQTLVQTSAPHNFVVGQQVAFRMPSPFGCTELNSYGGGSIPGQALYGYVTSVLSSTAFNVSINSSGFSALNWNLPMSGFNYGSTYPQIVAVGDYNFGSGLNSMAPLGMSPQAYIGGSTSLATFPLAPTIGGAYVSATYQGFIIGSAICGAADDVIEWVAYFDDLAL